MDFSKACERLQVPMVVTIKVRWEDIFENMNNTAFNKFLDLPYKKQRLLIRNYGEKIGEAVEKELMQMFPGSIRSAIWESGLLHAIDLEFERKYKEEGSRKYG